MKTILDIFLSLVIAAMVITVIYGIVSFAVAFNRPVPHLDPPVITVKRECGDRISRETVIQLFADAGDSLVIVDVSRCEKAFYIYKGAR